MNTIRITRELRLKNIELFRLKEGFYGKIICYMLFVDYKRASSLNDFPYLKEIEDENEFGRSNYIKVFFISEEQLKEELKEEVVSIAGGFLENKDDCHWNCFFEVINKSEFEKFLETKENMLSYFEKLLEINGLKLDLVNILPDKFNYLSQD
ncbi:MAG: hypothetical protein GX926_03165 [Candidatus Magasanikbacteria bacterium]|jgi:hypothetical protein|nr:hypothetical protein [Candidatus Magasanikbacteria bacterium]